MEIAFSPTCEQKIRGGGQDSTVAYIVLFEFPLVLAGPRVDRDDGAVADLVGPIINRAAAPDSNTGSIRSRCHGLIAAAVETPPGLIRSQLAPEEGSIVFP